MKRNRFEFMKVVLCQLLIACLVLPPTPAAAQKSYRDATGGFLNMTKIIDCTTPCTTNNTSVTPIDVGGFTSGVIIINVTAVSGTSPSLTVNFQTCDGTGGSAPANANCVNHTTGSAITATGLQIIKVDHFSRWITLTQTITGTTPSFTYTATGYFKPTS